jgi:hypothetical protein
MMYKVGDVFVGTDELHKGYVVTLLKCEHGYVNSFDVRWEKEGGGSTITFNIHSNNIDSWVRKGYIALESGKEYEDML